MFCLSIDRSHAPVTSVAAAVALQIPGLTSYVSGLVSSLSSLEAPSAILAASEGIGLAALGLGKEAHIDLLYKSQVRREASPCRLVALFVNGRRANPRVLSLKFEFEAASSVVFSRVRRNFRNGKKNCEKRREERPESAETIKAWAVLVFALVLMLPIIRPWIQHFLPTPSPVRA